MGLGKTDSCLKAGGERVYFQVLSQGIDRIWELQFQVLGIDMQGPHWLLAKDRFLWHGFP